jgi:hypothetical protein
MNLPRLGETWQYKLKKNMRGTIAMMSETVDGRTYHVLMSDGSMSEITKDTLCNWNKENKDG